MMAPLGSLRIIDLTQILSGPYATQILADLGADVIKVEPLWGDKARRNGPYKNGRSTYFASLNRGKKSVALDLKQVQGREILKRLVSVSDVLVENFRPGVLAKLGLNYESLKHINPQLVYAACSGFGHHGTGGPRAALDIVIQAMAGTMSVTGGHHGDPTRVGFSIGDIGAGLYLTIGILAALAARQETGQGSFVDISMLEAQVALMENGFARYFATSEIPGPLGSRHPVMAPFQAFHALDADMVVAVSTPAQWQALCKIVEIPEMAKDLRFSTSERRIQHSDELEQILTERLKTQPVSYWISRFEEAGVPAGPINNVAQASQEPSLADRRLFIEVDYVGVPFRVVGTPLNMDGMKCLASPTVPETGADTRDVLQSLLGLSSEELDDLYDREVVK